MDEARLASTQKEAFVQFLHVLIQAHSIQLSRWSYDNLCNAISWAEHLESVLSVSGNANEHLCVEAEEVLLNMKQSHKAELEFIQQQSARSILERPVQTLLGVILRNRTITPFILNSMQQRPTGDDQWSLSLSQAIASCLQEKASSTLIDHVTHRVTAAHRHQTATQGDEDHRPSSAVSWDRESDQYTVFGVPMLRTRYWSERSTVLRVESAKLAAMKLLTTATTGLEAKLGSIAHALSQFPATLELIVNIAILLPSAIAAAEAPPPLAPDALAKVIKEHADINQLYQLSGELMARLCELFPDLFLTGYTKRLIETALTHHNLVLSEFDHCDGWLVKWKQSRVVVWDCLRRISLLLEANNLQNTTHRWLQVLGLSTEGEGFEYLHEVATQLLTETDN